MSLLILKKYLEGKMPVTTEAKRGHNNIQKWNQLWPPFPPFSAL
jgi:hypothetical protein